MKPEPDAAPKEQRRHSRPRTSARLAAVQALYQIAMTGHAADHVVEEFVIFRLPDSDHRISFGPADHDLFRSVTLGTAKAMPEIDRVIAGALTDSWSPERLEGTLIAILRAGTHELLSHAMTPCAVVISEYVDITRRFDGGRAPGLVNGVLDRIAQTAREKPDREELDDSDDNGGVV